MLIVMTYQRNANKPMRFHYTPTRIDTYFFKRLNNSKVREDREKLKPSHIADET